MYEEIIQISLIEYWYERCSSSCFWWCANLYRSNLLFHPLPWNHFCGSAVTYMVTNFVTQYLTVNFCFLLISLLPLVVISTLKTPLFYGLSTSSGHFITELTCELLTQLVIGQSLVTSDNIPLWLCFGYQLIGAIKIVTQLSCINLTNLHIRLLADQIVMTLCGDLYL